MPAMPSFAGWPCPVARASQVLSDPWTTLVIRDALRGIRRFDDFRRSLGIPASTLASRLRALVDAGVLEARAYQDNPVRYEYHYTPKGRELFPVLLAMAHWADAWQFDGVGVAMKLRHTGCGAEFPAPAEPRCPGCGEQLAPETVEHLLGPSNPNRVSGSGDARFGFGRPSAESAAAGGQMQLGRADS